MRILSVFLLLDKMKMKPTLPRFFYSDNIAKKRVFAKSRDELFGQTNLVDLIFYEVRGTRFGPVTSVPQKNELR